MSEWSSHAPSNIALIKYMGKKDGNQPTNVSLSYTLSDLKTHVRLKPTDGDDHWVADSQRPLSLSESGQVRFVRYLQLLKKHYEVDQSFQITSYNDFPSDCGLASSASSFAALTNAFCTFLEDQKQLSVSPKERSQWSRQGSGSSCRSFFEPWAIWKDEFAEPIDLPYTKLIHSVAVVNDAKKEVSSSSAHKKIESSSLNQGRSERAQERYENLLQSLKAQDWKSAFEITWAEFWDMHALFETSQPSFGYMTSGSLQVLECVRNIWRETGDGPLCTMDAGPNVHVMFRSDQSDLAQKFFDGDASRFRWTHNEQKQ